MLFSMLATSLLRTRSSTNVELEISTDGQIRANGRLLSRFPMLWPEAVRDEVFRVVTAPGATEVRAEYDALCKSSTNFDGLPIGVTRTLDQISARIDQHQPHLLIVGPTGTGKSVLLANLAKNCRHLIDVDFKGGRNLASVPALLRLNNLDSGHDEMWKRVSDILDERERLLEQSTQPIYFFVDELSAVVSSSPLASRVIERIATRGRSGQVFLIAATQSLAGIPRSIILNCHHRVLLGSVDAIDRTQLGLKAQSPRRQLSNELLTGEYSSGETTEEFYFPRPVTSTSALPQRLSEANPLSG